jgi:hypothetical protein
VKLDELVARVPDNGLFRTGHILSGQRSPAGVRRQLDRWVKAGRVIQLRRGVYVLAGHRGTVSVHPFAAANALKKASYVSLESALSHYGMIPEHVAAITSVTTGRPQEFATPLGRFIFRHVTGRMFDGFREIEPAPLQPALVATPAKALVDLLYLTPGSDQAGYLEELRIERPEMDGFSEALNQAAERSDSDKVRRAVRRLRGIWEGTDSA